MLSGPLSTLRHEVLAPSSRSSRAKVSERLIGVLIGTHRRDDCRADDENRNERGCPDDKQGATAVRRLLFSVIDLGAA